MTAVARLNYCRSCGTDFASVAAFDRHRVGVHAYTYTEGLDFDIARDDGRRCMDADEMRAAGMDLDARGRWAVVADAERIRRAFPKAA